MIPRLIITTLAILFCAAFAQAQYITPGTGVKWTMADMVENSNGAVVKPAVNYRVHQSFTVSANDTLEIKEVTDIAFDSVVLVTVEGTLIADPASRIYFTPLFSGSGYPGFRFEENSSILLNKVSFFEAGGIKCLTRDFYMDSCEIKYFSTKLNTGAALEFSRGKPVVTHSVFEQNQRAAISSAANAHVAPVIMHNRFIQNSTQNTNRPQINLGPSGPTDTTVIIKNFVEGGFDMAGGIAFSSLLGDPANVLIQDNEIMNNRYGIAVTGTNIRSRIIGNQLVDNNIQNLPLLGGSGININTSASGNNFAYIESNYISGNLWGITLQGNSTANLGDSTSNNFNPGLNRFSNNGNEGHLYALFNNTPNPVPAMNNCWLEDEGYDAQDAENVISHQNDDPALGKVIFEPFSICSSVSVHEPVVLQNIKAYPNPASDKIMIENISQGTEISLVHISGKIISKRIYQESDYIEIPITDIQAGMYLLGFRLNNEQIVCKIMITSQL